MPADIIPEKREQMTRCQYQQREFKIGRKKYLPYGFQVTELPRQRRQSGSKQKEQEHAVNEGEHAVMDGKETSEEQLPGHGPGPRPGREQHPKQVKYADDHVFRPDKEAEFRIPTSQRRRCRPPERDWPESERRHLASSRNHLVQ